MASIINRFGLVLLILVASTTFFPDKAQADYWSCMYNCRAGYILCCQYCFSESIGEWNHPTSNGMRKANNAAPSKNYATPPLVLGGEKQLYHSHRKHYKRSKHSKHAHH
ncbi:hypothetical protein MKX03_021422 [Papaver bracteatum]|nr:hypothetical protein MKX03_021422 [Papaver bracteatum]